MNNLILHFTTREWISKHMSSKVWDNINYPFPNFNSWCLGTDPTLYNGCHYLSILWFQLNHVCKRATKQNMHNKILSKYTIFVVVFANTNTYSSLALVLLVSWTHLSFDIFGFVLPESIKTSHSDSPSPIMFSTTGTGTRKWQDSRVEKWLISVPYVINRALTVAVRSQQYHTIIYRTHHPMNPVFS